MEPASDRTVRHRTHRSLIGATALLLAAATACASGSDSSFTSLAAADTQARAWVDGAMTAAIPEASPADGHSEGPDTCTSSADFGQFSYSSSVDVPVDQVDSSTAAVWQAFADDGFAPSVDDVAVSPAPPTPPGPGSPSWTIVGFHDGFRLELTGSRVAPTRVSAYLVTPCLKTT